MWKHVNEWAKVALICFMLFLVLRANQQCDCDEKITDPSDEDVAKFIEEKFPGTKVEIIPD